MSFKLIPQRKLGFLWDNRYTEPSLVMHLVSVLTIPTRAFKWLCVPSRPRVPWVPNTGGSIRTRTFVTNGSFCDSRLLVNLLRIVSIFPSL